MIFILAFAIPIAALALSDVATPVSVTSLETSFTSEPEHTSSTIIEATYQQALPEPDKASEPTFITSEPTEEPESHYVYYDVPLSDDIQTYAQDICSRYGFEHYDIIVALIGAESSYREAVISKTNDYGYMQINSCNHEWLTEMFGPLDFTEAHDNILCGIYILDNLCDKYGDIGLALMAYNCGEKGASDLWEQGVYSTNYSRNIQAQASELVLSETSSN